MARPGIRARWFFVFDIITITDRGGKINRQHSFDRAASEVI
jgi:hypothetical protein